MTPQELFEADVWLTRQQSVIYQIEWLGVRQKDLAKAMKLSQSRIFQIYHNGKKHQRQGII